MLKLFLLVALYFQFALANAQKSDSLYTDSDSINLVPVIKTLCLLTGLNYSNHVFSDIGLSVNFSPSGGIHPAAGSYYIANELHFVNKPFIGPKLGFAVSILIWSFGANVIYYTDFKKRNAFTLRPEIGLGVDRFRVMYGFNKILNKSVDRLSKNNIGVVYCFKLKKLKIIPPHIIALDK